MTRTHQHPCQYPGCVRPVLCDGDRTENVDGWPAVVCDRFHREAGELEPTVLCELHAPERR